ncbi:hypothetical protein [Pseudomonas baetica]|uniref:hypothetical protein n=1 Tax=Pseudomonas baetica TaxID=674054 RepID=UPI0024056470|nr:hypothetical protein [Pseudomonas baetica]MDF9777391.1 hypothetical protein [Pseudomonas baetica]
MSVEKQCASCDKLFTCNRSHAVTCSSTCRGIKWRSKKEAVVSVKIAFSAHRFALLKENADRYGLSINDYIIQRSTGSVITTVERA